MFGYLLQLPPLAKSLRCGCGSGRQGGYHVEIPQVLKQDLGLQ